MLVVVLLNTAVIALGGPEWLQPLSWAVAFHDLFVRMCAWFGDVLGRFWLCLSEFLWKILEKLGPSLSQSISQLIVFLMVVPHGLQAFRSHMKAVLFGAAVRIAPYFTLSVMFIVTFLLAIVVALLVEFNLMTPYDPLLLYIIKDNYSAFIFAPLFVFATVWVCLVDFRRVARFFDLDPRVRHQAMVAEARDRQPPAQGRGRRQSPAREQREMQE